jgi:hypothetical protein
MLSGDDSKMKEGRGSRVGVATLRDQQKNEIMKKLRGLRAALRLGMVQGLWLVHVIPKTKLIKRRNFRFDGVDTEADFEDVN